MKLRFTVKRRRQLSEAAKWTVMSVLIVIGGYVYNWNEYDSPWGQEIQAAKLQHLKVTLCN
jgi:hypothetical protein